MVLKEKVTHRGGTNDSWRRRYRNVVQYDFSISVDPTDRPDSLRAALLEAIDRVGEYPDLEQRQFRETVAEFEGLSPDQIWGGNGASELIMGLAYALRPRRALLPAPCFSGSRRALEASGNCDVAEVALRDEDNFDLTERFVERVAEEFDVVFVTNPNNPTGRLIAPSVMEKLLSRCVETQTALVVDECFLRLSHGGVSVRDRVGEFPNLYVIDSLTKLFGIPGVRVGYAISADANIARLREKLPEWNLSTFATAAARACLKTSSPTDHIARALSLIGEEREYLARSLRGMGLRVVDSDANFLLFEGPEKLAERALERGLLIRDCSNFSGLTKGFFRIAVRKRVENELLVRTIAEIVGKEHED